jgi:hypothetical protein
VSHLESTDKLIPSHRLIISAGAIETIIIPSFPSYLNSSITYALLLSQNRLYRTPSTNEDSLIKMGE